MAVSAKQFLSAAVARYPSEETVLCSHCFHKKKNKKKMAATFTQTITRLMKLLDFRVSHGKKREREK